MGCCGSKELEDDHEKSPLLKDEAHQKVKPTISAPQPSWVHSGPTSPATGSAVGSRTTSPALSRQASVSSFADYDVLKRMRGLYTYSPMYDDELAFQEGDIIEITNMDNPNWYFGRLKGKTGLVPTNYLTNDASLQPPQTPLSPLSPSTTSPANKEEQKIELTRKLVQIQDEFTAEISKFYQGYLQPLLVSKLLQEGEFEAMFSNFKGLLDVNTRLTAALKASESQDNLGMAGAILVEHVANFNAFLPYCTNFPLGVSIHRNVQERPGVAALVQGFGQGQPGAVEKYMSRPLQHISRFPGLVQKILEATPEYHLDHDNLVNAFEHTEAIRKSVNEETNRVMERSRLQQIQQKLHSELQKQKIEFFSENYRHLLREGMVTTEKTSIPLRAFLFDDLLLFLRENSKTDLGEKYSLFKKIILHTATIEEIRVEESFQAIKSLIKSTNVLPVPEKVHDEKYIRITEGGLVAIEFRARSSVETEGWLSACENAQKVFLHAAREEYQLNPIFSGLRLRGLKYCHQVENATVVQLDGLVFVSDSPKKVDDLQQVIALGNENSRIRFSDELGLLFVKKSSNQAVFAFPKEVLTNPDFDLAKVTSFEEVPALTGFDIGPVGEISLLLIGGAKQITAYQTDEKGSFFKLADINLPRGLESFERKAYFVSQGCFLSFGTKLFLVNESPTLREVGDLASKKACLGCFDVNGSVFAVYEDHGVLLTDEGKVDESGRKIAWFAPANHCARLSDAHFAIFTKSWIEVWDLERGNFLHSISISSPVSVGAQSFVVQRGENPTLYSFSKTPVRVNDEF